MVTQQITLLNRFVLARARLTTNLQWALNDLWKLMADAEDWREPPCPS